MLLETGRGVHVHCWCCSVREAFGDSAQLGQPEIEILEKVGDLNRVLAALNGGCISACQVRGGHTNLTLQLHHLFVF